jgi:peroxiredoxin
MQIFRKSTKSLDMLLIFLILAVFGCVRTPSYAARIDNVVSKDIVLNNITPNGIVLNDLQGASVNLSRLKNPTILFFWTTWCPYCRKEIKALNQIYPQMQKEGITVFAVNVGESAYRVQRFFKDYVLNFRVLLDKDQKLADNYDLLGVPTYIFLDKHGLVVLRDNSLPADYKNLLFK